MKMDPAVRLRVLASRARRALFYVGVEDATDTQAIREALRAGRLVPGKHPTSYGWKVHAYICRKAGFPVVLPKPPRLWVCPQCGHHGRQNDFDTRKRREDPA